LWYGGEVTATPRDRALAIGPERREADKQAGLRRAQKAAEKQELATSARDNAIRLSYESGASLRQIADVTGLGTMTIQRIVTRRRQP
jgi:hypothetical protein